MTNPHLTLVAPTTIIGTVGDRRKPPCRKRNAEVRAREYLTDGEIARLIDAAGRNRHGHRDATMVLVAYRHGLRAAELVMLRWAPSTSPMAVCISGGSKAAPSRSIHCPAGSCGPCAGLTGSKSLIHRSFSRLSGGRRSCPRGFVRCSRGWAPRLASTSP